MSQLECGGGGGVGGAGSGTDNHIVRWDGTSSIQDSGLSIDDTGHLDGITGTTGRVDVTNIGGTTTANAVSDGGTITGIGTTFLQTLRVGDRISLSSAPTNYATVASIASDLSITIQGIDFLASALGDGSSQTINRKSLIHRWDNSSAIPVASLNDRGMFVVGDPTLTGASGFFTSDAAKFLSYQTYTGINNLLSIGNAFNMTWTPSNDTNLGTFGLTAAAAGGAQMTITGAKNLNGGILFGNTLTLSAIGSFGALGIDTTAGSTIDGTAGIYFSTEHDSLGGILTLGVGGFFNFDTTDNAGLGTPTGSVGTGIGGLFTSSAQGCNITNAVGGKFIEPFVLPHNGGTPTITNKTAAWIDGTYSVTRSDVASAASITDMAVSTSWIKITGSTTSAIHGIHADTFEKKITIYNGSTAVVAIKNQSATDGTAANRIITPTGQTVYVPAGYSVDLEYDANQSRWILIRIPITGTSAVVALTDGATPALDASLGGIFTLTAAGNRTIAVPSNPLDGQKIIILHLASGGARTLSLNTGAGGFVFGTDITALTATTSAATDSIGCVYNGTLSKWMVVAYVKGFA